MKVATNVRSKFNRHRVNQLLEEREAAPVKRQPDSQKSSQELSYVVNDDMHSQNIIGESADRSTAQSRTERTSIGERKLAPKLALEILKKQDQVDGGTFVFVFVGMSDHSSLSYIG